jgi:uncharacterized protein (DUF3084 family)
MKLEEKVFIPGIIYIFSIKIRVPVAKEKDSLTKEHERVLGEVDTLKQRLKSVATYNQELEVKIGEAEQQISELQDIIDQQNNDMMKARREREKTESEIEDVYEELKIRSAQLQVLNHFHIQGFKNIFTKFNILCMFKTVEETLKETQNNVIKQEKLLMDQIIETEKCRKEIQKMLLKEISMKTLSDKLEAKIESIDKELTDKNRHIKDLHKDIKR